MTTQAQLQHYFELKQAAKKAEAAVEEAKKAIVAGHDGDVEAGIRRLKIETRSSQSFSYDAMVDAVGRLQADKIKSLLPVKSTVYVTVD